MSISVVIACSNPTTNGLLHAALASQQQLRILGEINSLEEIKGCKPDVVLVAGPDAETIPFCERILFQAPKIKVVLVTESGHEAHVNQAIGAGIAGVVLLNNLGSDLVKAICAVAKGHHFLSSEVADAAVAFYRNVPVW